MDREDLVRMRLKAQMTQTDLACELGLSLRTYQGIENSPKKIRKRDAMAIERSLLDRAVQTNDPTIVPENLRRVALAFAEIIRVSRDNGTDVCERCFAVMKN